MASVFWDAKRIIMIDYLPKGRTIIGAHYVEQLDNLREVIREKRLALSRKKILFHQDNAPAHTSKIAMAKIVELGFKLVSHPPYSQDLAPSDFSVSPKSKDMLAGQRFSSNSEVISFTEGYFEGLDKYFHKTETTCPN